MLVKVNTVYPNEPGFSKLRCLFTLRQISNTKADLVMNGKSKFLHQPGIPRVMVAIGNKEMLGVY